MPASPPHLMTTREVAEYLRIKQRKVYELAQRGEIPASRVMGKWLFQRNLIERWLGENTAGAVGAGPAPPRIVAGSHDPLLDWAVRESGSELAVMFDGSSDGLRRFARGEAVMCGLHLIDGGSGEYNVPAARQALDGRPFVLIEWAWRERGLCVPPGNPLGLRSLGDVAARGARLADRQEGAGARLLLEHLWRAAGLDPAGPPRAGPPARNETDLALAVAEGEADVCFGLAAAARQFRLDFVPLARERYDLALLRRDYFEPPAQALLAFARAPRFAEKAATLAGYDVAGCGRVVYNAPG